MTLGTIVRRAGVCGALVLVLSAPAFGDEWVRVAVGGLGDLTRMEASRLAVFGSEVYLATHQWGGVVGTPRAFRAPIRDDRTWEEVTPRGMTGEVTSMEVVVDVLLVSAGGQLWQRDRAGRWTDVTPSPAGWGRTRAILYATGWTPRTGGRIYCVARTGLEVWCKENLSPWSLLPLPGALGADTSIGTATLQAYSDRLYLGFGGTSEGSRTCEAWRRDFSARRWEPVSTDCFGRPHQTWLLSMAVFGGRLYFGIGGGGAQTGVVRTDGRALEDVTPCALYLACTGLWEAPTRYQAMATAAGRLFVGVRYGGAAMSGGHVLRTNNGTAWSFAAEAGFGVVFNDEIISLGSSRAYLYAGTYNGSTGFEVWRRTPTLRELHGYLLDDSLGFLRDASAIRSCLLARPACDWTPIVGPIDDMTQAFDAARHSKDDPQIIKAGRAGMSEAASLIAQAQTLAETAAQAPKGMDTGQLRSGAADLLANAMEVVWKTVVSVGDYLALSGQQLPTPSAKTGGWPAR